MQSTTHANNVLIHKNDIKVANFDLAKKASETSNYDSTEVYGLLPYIDLLSSGQKPFCDEGIQYNARLAINIVGGKREEFIKRCNSRYQT
ncbi:hypothetical protein C1646_778454 [Rhizophagus diaphanus]|nr:hypothetical protein C1646_778454 [Rhizophagus diaphanus] [Rhizophagus sp. MUCL 43196]